MGLDFHNLDDRTREFMLAEIERDASSDRVYISNYLNEAGQAAWIDILRNAARVANDDWIAAELRQRNLLKHQAERRKPSGGYTMAKVPHTAPETLGEGEFGRYYVRGLCARSIDDGIEFVEVYRAKAVMQPRPGSEEKIGTRVRAAVILEDLRTMIGVEPALGLPPGPNSGLMLRIP